MLNQADVGYTYRKNTEISVKHSSDNVQLRYSQDYTDYCHKHPEPHYIHSHTLKLLECKRIQL
jgi:hypothetical protein